MSQSDTILTATIHKVGQTPYRKFIEYLIKEHSTMVLQQRAMGGINTLSEAAPELAHRLQPAMMAFIDHINAKYGMDWYFWQSATCENAIWVFIAEGINRLPVAPLLTRPEDALVPGKNQLVAYVLYQVPTMSFAYSASTQKEQRKFMGIRKGLFG